MQTDPIISYRNLDSSPAVQALIKKRISAVERINDRITGCEVILQAPQKRKLHGRIFKVRLNLHLPGPDLTISRTVAQGSAQDDLMLAVNRAFSAAEKQLKHQKKMMQAVEVKQHPPILHGEISVLEPELGWGYIEADDGREVYFQRDSLTTDVWDQLAKGTRLRFREFQGEKGAFAAAVTMVK